MKLKLNQKNLRRRELSSSTRWLIRSVGAAVLLCHVSASEGPASGDSIAPPILGKHNAAPRHVNGTQDREKYKLKLSGIVL